MILFFDSSDFDLVHIALIGKDVSEHKFATKNLSELLLPETKKFLKKQKTKLEAIRVIAVVTGPGGFSRIRTAVATANSLGFGLNVPVTGLQKARVPTDLKKLASLRGQKLVLPKYGKKPNISKPKNS